MINKKHKQMLETIEREAKFTVSYTGRDKFNQRVMDAMAEVVRENFVSSQYLPFAYDNGPLPIGYGQTISQPYIVALMTDLLDLTAESIVLEIGTGSGYQAAVLSLLAKQVYSIERVKELSELARERLKDLGYNNVEIRNQDGYTGWQEKAPFDGIIVTAAASHIPPALIEQLKPGGRMVVPVGLPHSYQELMLLVKDEEGKTQTESLLGVAFVPLITDEESDAS
ncbi:MAG: protein-L-isoaspartate(D-aspartate) O-methyltransferase [Gammaproteobacteria bacterium]|nr:protein-L-isoaspartate(D-aspartate) O-methyltransferase [Gammaproteobacteria bacterium]